MRINWGNKIIIAYTIFVLGMLFMVYKCTLQKNELTETDYYSKELKYQEIITGIDNANQLSNAVKLIQESSTINLVMPLEALPANGSIQFYRPSDQTKDFSVALATDENGKQLFGRDKFIEGLYKVKIRWQKNGKQFYNEQNLFIN